MTADSSAGTALAGCPAAILAGLLARAAVDALDPVVLLGLVKHPLTRLGLDPETLERQRLALERHGLRGPRRTSWAALAAKLDGRREKKAPDAEIDDALALSAHLESTLAALGAPFTGEGGTAAPAEAALALTRTLEALAADVGGSTGQLWAGHGGEALQPAAVRPDRRVRRPAAGHPPRIRRPAVATGLGRDRPHRRGHPSPPAHPGRHRGPRWSAPTGWSWPAWRKASGHRARRSTRSCRGRCARSWACRRPSAGWAWPPTTSPRPPARRTWSCCTPNAARARRR